MYRLPAKSRIEFIALKVHDMNQMVDFYTKVIGLYLISRNEHIAYLGFPLHKRVFICLKKIDSDEEYSNPNMANIKSFSLVLPNQTTFKKILVYIRNLGIKIKHVNTNLFLDSFHLTDPEGNNVTLEYDKVSASVISKHQNVINNVKKVDLDDYLGAFRHEIHHIPYKTRIYRIQMSVPNLKQSIQFYHKQLGFRYQTSINNNKIIISSSRNQKQQLILNQNKKLMNHKSNLPGLDYVNIRMSKASEIMALAKHLDKDKMNFAYNRTNSFIFVSDPSDINLIFSLL